MLDVRCFRLEIRLLSSVFRLPATGLPPLHWMFFTAWRSFARSSLSPVYINAGRMQYRIIGVRFNWLVALGKKSVIHA
jgi:hypothetical protein